MNHSDYKRNASMLRGSMAKRGYVRWWHTFTGICPGSLDSRTFFVEYMIMNPALGGNEPILGQHPYYRKRGLKPSYVMVKAGVFPDSNHPEGKQLHAFYPISSLKTAFDPLYVQIEDCYFSENRISGYVDVSPAEAAHPSLMSDDGYMEWDLELYKDIACHTGLIAGKFFTALNALDSFWHGEGIRTMFRGRVVLDGVTYEVAPDTCFGYADKHWGRCYNNPWLQFASCKMTSARTGRLLKHSALAIDGCCPRFLCFPLRRKLMIQLTYTGEDFEYNFTKPLSFSRCKWKVKETNKRFIWHIKAQNKTSVIKISGNCLKESMLPILYETPDGRMRRHPLLGSGDGKGMVELYRRVPGGLQLIDTLTIEQAFCEYAKTE